MNVITDRIKIAHERGKITEEKVFLALQKLEEERKISSSGQTIDFYSDDLKGIDFLVYLFEGAPPIKLSVSTSPKPKKEQKRLFRKGIIYFYIPIKMVDQNVIKEMIIRLIETHQLKEKRNKEKTRKQERRQKF